MPAGTREQLAAAIVEGQDSLPGPSLEIYGEPNLWSVAVVNAYEGPTLWLGTARDPTRMREFKTLEAAHAAAVAVQRLAYPDEESTRGVRIAGGVSFKKYP